MRTDFRFSPIPVLVHKVEQDGEYLLEVRDVIYRSHHDFVYRMRLCALPGLTHAFPLGGRRNTDVQLELHGVNLPGERLAVKIPADASDVHWVTVQRHGPLVRTPFRWPSTPPEAIETEPNDTPAAAQAIAVPVVINGRIDTAGRRRSLRLPGRSRPDARPGGQRPAARLPAELRSSRPMTRRAASSPNTTIHRCRPCPTPSAPASRTTRAR